MWARSEGRGGETEPGKARLFGSLSVSPSTSGDKGAPSSRLGVLRPAPETVFPVPATSQIHSAENSQPAKVPYFGVAYPELSFLHLKRPQEVS